MKNSNFPWIQKIAYEFGPISIYHIVAYVIYFAISAVLSKLAGWLLSLSLVNQILLLLVIALVPLILFIAKIWHKIWPKKSVQPFGREKEILQLVEEIKNRNSSVIVGIFANERIAILDYLSDESNKVNLYGKKCADQLIFSYLDMGVQSSDNFDHSKFWEQALIPVYQTMTDEEKIAYDDAKQAGFDNFSLDKLFQQMKRKEQRLVLMIDGFHRIIKFDKLNSPVFFGNLRARSSHEDNRINRINLILTVGGYQQLCSLNTQEPGKTYEFNHLNKLTLKSLTQNEVEIFLEKQALLPEEREWIKKCGITHPHLLAKMLECLKSTGHSRTIFSLLRKSRMVDTQRCKEKIEQYLSNIIFSSHYLYLCEALFSIVKNEMDNLSFDALNDLREQGFLEKSNGQWQICSGLIVEFLRERLRETSQPCGNGKVK
ncbi:MAG: hypothetical protein BWK78_02310 [Thiotrichaceae bacterium IS1]|nr:MAG: hypothetical protein BWK78_02310 [Thiotrichaceae bacterium IS1]